MKAIECKVCRKGYKRRDAFWVCDGCAAITCKRCIGNGHDRTTCPRGEVSRYSKLLDVMPRLKDVGFNMSYYELTKRQRKGK